MPGWNHHLIALIALLLAESASAATGPARLTPLPYHPGVPLEQYWVREQFQGVRAYWDGERLLDQNGKPIKAPPAFTGGFPATPLEGELWMGRAAAGQRQTLDRRSPTTDQWRHLYFVALDLPNHPGTFDERLTALRALLGGTPTSPVRLAPYVRVRSHRDLSKHLQRILAKGGRGLVLHRRTALYRHTGAEDLLEWRPDQQDEARVVAVIREAGRRRDAVTGLLVQTGSGRHIRLLDGLNEALRAQPPPIGSVVRYAFQGYTQQGRPRSPRFLEVLSAGPGLVP